MGFCLWGFYSWASGSRYEFTSKVVNKKHVIKLECGTSPWAATNFPYTYSSSIRCFIPTTPYSGTDVSFRQFSYLCRPCLIFSLALIAVNFLFTWAGCGNNTPTPTKKMAKEQTCLHNSALAVNPVTGDVAYPAGCVVVIYQPRRNRQFR